MKGVYIPLQEKVLRRYMQQAGITALPNTFDACLSFVTRILEENKKKGGIAEKFEAGYFRSLYFADPPRQAAAAVYQKYHSGGVRMPEEYKTFRDYVFRYLVREGGRLKLAVDIHLAVGEGGYFSIVLNLENVLKDPRYLDTTFVLIHGGYPLFPGSDMAGVDEECLHRYLGNRKFPLPFRDENSIEALAGDLSGKDYLRFGRVPI
jgi:uncharacterized protein